MVFTKILLGGISVSLLSGYYFLQKEKKVYKVFESLEKIPEFDLDYLGKLEDLPLNQPIALCGDVDTVNSLVKASEYNPKKRILFSTIRPVLPVQKKVTKQNLNDEDETFDEFYYSIPNKDLPKFYLKNEKEERIEIQWPNEQRIGFFNVKPIVEKIDLEKSPSIPPQPILTRLSNLFTAKKNAEYAEVGLKVDDKYVYVGELITPPSGNAGKVPVNLIFKPQYVLGDSQNYFLKYLDGQLIRLNKNGKMSFFIGMALTSVHLCNKLFLYYESQMKKSQEMTAELEQAERSSQIKSR